MRALALAGGTGTRLRPITHTVAKQLLPVGNKPILFYCLEALAEAGIRDVGIVVGRTAPEVRAAVGDGAQFGVEATYIPQAAPLGLAHAVLTARNYLGDDDFVMYLGDNLIMNGIDDLVGAFHKEHPDAQVLIGQVPDPQAFGVVELDGDGGVVGLEEKPSKPKSNLALAGVYVFGPAVHDVVRTLKPSPRGELEITDALQQLIAAGHRVESTTVTGTWKDTGSLPDILEANRLVLERLEPRLDGSVDSDSEIIGRVAVERGAVITGSRIIGPAVIGAQSVIQDSYVGPFTSIARRCQVLGSEIEYSIVLTGASIRDVRRIGGSLIGHDAKVGAAPWRTNTHRLLVGDHCMINIGS
jgi:glucose-1-phosphate thymidylyltransferase